MTLFTGAKIRRLIPAGAVAAVIAFSWLTPAPSLASSTNNCGVKGYGYHDHGKPCPNRPFPGKGAGLAKFGINVATAPNGHIKHSVDTATSAGENVNLSLDTDDTSSAGNGHGHGHVHGHGKGHPSA